MVHTKIVQPGRMQKGVGHKMINPFLWVMWFFIGLTVFVLVIWTLIKFDDWEDRRNENNKR